MLEDNITSDSKHTISLYLIPSLVPPRGRTKVSGNKQWKPSITESRDGIFLHVKVPGDIERANKEFMYQRGLTVQPYLIIVGQSLSNVTSAYVVINNNLYNTVSVLDAVDFCFKAYHMLDAKYSYESHHIWYLIQWSLYSLYTKSDIKIPFIQDCLI
ncbi:uncharacterized protein LOC123317551 [Coccinella septempunctata]|uniref:uncharacterized protein LOC123317551 n=1 Tax=Coccinella septempunctata TaxID=41139 RepID=UPI001D08C1DB|nr:uncharacterized protein LOC123317551 [Coccinella septempunctata]